MSDKPKPPAWCKEVAEKIGHDYGWSTWPDNVPIIAALIARADPSAALRVAAQFLLDELAARLQPAALLDHARLIDGMADVEAALAATSAPPSDEWAVKEIHECRELARGIPDACEIRTPDVPTIVRRLIEFAWHAVSGSMECARCERVQELADAQAELLVAYRTGDSRRGDQAVARVSNAKRALAADEPQGAGETDEQ